MDVRPVAFCSAKTCKPCIFSSSLNVLRQLVKAGRRQTPSGAGACPQARLELGRATGFKLQEKGRGKQHRCRALTTGLSKTNLLRRAGGRRGPEAVQQTTAAMNGSIALANNGLELTTPSAGRSQSALEGGAFVACKASMAVMLASRPGSCAGRPRWQRLRLPRSQDAFISAGLRPHFPAVCVARPRTAKSPV